MNYGSLLDWLNLGIFLLIITVHVPRFTTIIIQITDGIAFALKTKTRLHCETDASPTDKNDFYFDTTWWTQVLQPDTWYTYIHLCHWRVSKRNHFQRFIHFESPVQLKPHCLPISVLTYWNTVATLYAGVPDITYPQFTSTPNAK